MDRSRERRDLAHEPAWVRWLFEIDNDLDDELIVTPSQARGLRLWFDK